MSGLREQKARFYASVLPARPNEWEVDEVFDQLAELPAEMREILLGQVEAIWPVSHSLCFAYLTAGRTALQLFAAELIPEWVRRILAVYEKKGLAGARAFMDDVDKSFLGPMRGEAGVALAEVSPVLLPYIRGVSGLHLHLDCAAVPGTDTGTIYLPEHLDQFPEREKNVLLYKMIVSLQWAQLASGIYQEAAGTSGEDQPDCDPLADFSDRLLAADLLAALQFSRVYRLVAAELPGLIRQGRGLCLRLIEAIAPRGSAERCRALQDFLHQAIAAANVVNRLDQESPAIDSFALLPDIYKRFSRLGGSYHLGPASLLLGELNFTRATEAIRLRRNDEKQKFVALLAAHLAAKERRSGDPSRQEGGLTTALADILALLPQASTKPGTGEKQRLLLDNEGMLVPEALVAAARTIINDLGHLPQAYAQAAAGMAGGGFPRQENESPAEQDLPPLPAPAASTYDEWDFRRGGYRTDWCTLEEKSLLPARSGFVAATLGKYGPLLKRLRRQFELLRTSDRVVRRQREGDDIDLDALIEALGDYRAGFIPSDRLFTRLLHDERDIAAMFLVDMSSSTEGWVSVALKETLVLLAEALEIVGDRYGIYGFSGMRRSRSQLFHIKHPEEPYGAVVQQRIAAIAPKEYTRMGPPIRHLTRKLRESPGRIRLLIVISDGKPEDYDDYKGQYAIEDTRKALLEAKGLGVHPFCITIDKSAHDYLAHMFGPRNFIFVNDVKLLPVKMVHMYRLLTS